MKTTDAVQSEPVPLSDPSDHHRSVFRLSGLRYGRHFGSKSGYVAAHPNCFYIPNACIYTSQRICCWRGDLDLADEADRLGLVDAARRLRRMLFVLREQTHGIQSQREAWLAEIAIVTVWRGRITTSGYTRRLFGTFKQAMARYQSASR